MHRDGVSKRPVMKDERCKLGEGGAAGAMCWPAGAPSTPHPTYDAPKLLDTGAGQTPTSSLLLL